MSERRKIHDLHVKPDAIVFKKFRSKAKSRNKTVTLALEEAMILWINKGTLLGGE